MKVVVTIGPRLWGNCSGLGRECVRSKRPHLLHNCCARTMGKQKPKSQQPSSCGGVINKKVLTTLPGVRLDRRQVDVSVVRQL